MGVWNKASSNGNLRHIEDLLSTVTEVIDGTVGLIPSPASVAEVGAGAVFVRLPPPFGPLAISGPQKSPIQVPPASVRFSDPSILEQFCEPATLTWYGERDGPDFQVRRV